MLETHAADRIHRVEDAFANWYIVEEDARLTIVDTGLPRSWKSLHSALRDLRRKPGDIDAVVLTHGHFDHVGFAERARRELGVTLYAPQDDLEVVAHPWRYDHERSRAPYFLNPRFLWMFTAMGAAGALWVKGTREVRPYAENGVLDVPGRPHVVATPGHTHGHVSLHFPSRGTLIAGDAIVTLDPYTGSRGPQIVSGAATADSARALASLHALEDTGAQTVMTGHGPVWREGIAAAVEQARERGPS